MDKVDTNTNAPSVTHLDSKAPDGRLANGLEHELTLNDICKNHKSLIGWSFYWAFCAIGWGFDAQINGAMISVASFRRDFGHVVDGEAILPASSQLLFTIIPAVCSLISAFICSLIADRIGRKAALAIGICFATGGAFAEMFCTTLAAFTGAKILVAIGLSFYLTLAPLTCSEIAPVILRGLSTAGVNLGIAVGQLVSNAVVKIFGERDDVWAYRGPFATQLFFCVVLAFLLPFAPESPWFLVRIGKREEAKASLRQLYGKESDVDLKLAAIELTIEQEAGNNQNKLALLQCWRGTDRGRTLISMFAFVCQQFTGIIFVLGYSTYFFQLAGLDVSQSFDLGVGVTACGVAGNFLNWFVVNSYGRRRIFLAGMVIITALLLLIGIMDMVPTSAAKWVQASCTVIYAFVYFATIGAVGYVLLGETSSTALRASTTAWAAATQAILGLAMSFAIPYMVNPDEGNLNGKVGFVFGGLAAIVTIGSWAIIPELKGRTFEEIDRMFQMRVPPRKMGSYKFSDNDL
ncbi:maltose permease [Thozetella sp. PMI_491]|nr:maltose permease [Thozetella sp. PMI_491]